MMRAATPPRVRKPRTLPAVILGYTTIVKTAISLPDETFDQVRRRASELGMSRSEFFVRAARRYLDQLEEESIVAQIDEVASVVNEDSSSRAAVASGRCRLSMSDDTC